MLGPGELETDCRKFGKAIFLLKDFLTDVIVFQVKIESTTTTTISPHNRPSKPANISRFWQNWQTVANLAGGKNP
jgi:hypothetical protein